MLFFAIILQPTLLKAQQMINSQAQPALVAAIVDDITIVAPKDLAIQIAKLIENDLKNIGLK